ncbi:MAG: phosphoenolpyruvate mutase [Nitrospirota bacterium]
MDKENKASRLRELFKRPGVIRIVGAHNALGAKLIERAGFEGVWASGLEISASYALPDANIVSMFQFLEAARQMNEAVSIPVVSDCDTGYGNANNVIYMVKMFEATGIAAVCIEDKIFPKDNSLLEGGRQRLTSIEEFQGKIRAAKDTQESKDFMVIARVEALIAGWGQDEALKRANAYVDAGADAILIHSKKSTPEEIVEFTKRWKGYVPLVVVPTNYPMITIKELQELGIKMVIYANHGLRAAVKAMEDVFEEIKRTGCISTIEDKIVPMKHIFELQGTLEMKEKEGKYLPS